MSLENKGLNKLSEECAELTVVCQKRLICKSDTYYDGTDMRQWLKEEIADVLASIDIVLELHNIHPMELAERRREKLEKFRTWAKE